MWLSYVLGLLLEVKEHIAMQKHLNEWLLKALVTLKTPHYDSKSILVIQNEKNF